MAVYAIGDLHGCLDELQRLLALIRFDPAADRLYFTGDLISRGPHGLDCMRLVQSLGAQAVTLLGNHEVRLLALEHGALPASEHHWHRDYLQAEDRSSLYQWVRQMPLMVQEPLSRAYMVHAGIPAHWSLAQAQALAQQTVAYLRDDAGIIGLFGMLRRGLPQRDPGPEADPLERSAFVMTALTRMRLCNREGQLIWPKQLKQQGIEPYGFPAPECAYQPWFAQRGWQAGEKVLYGHWAMAGLQLKQHSLGLDSGCVYGGQLTALRLDDPEHPIAQVCCPGYTQDEA
ncbi:Bis(5'-nucleosyl)-tetraphosphatase (symmetrical) [Magnetococcus marinus MC-1]|uniref:bis(5'-nucleosyl)-tetraphosphatase (symmetrical) n=1 Tax=Magnetococcus marinus (strain ATCC BAA-1437 / JCM 17883 / MC-1) TaxID=156889 RepID=A0L5C1_MAGMM|nr:symmetrical bis(5'-nucleosyl)-tetraphosphatase [Magnetococcus marinus]ABK43164.1 Bis(5'-nucleosyl)-tetraphosphatase (symmetrical) [Magnetococcus marinus MC-1]